MVNAPNPETPGAALRAFKEWLPTVAIHELRNWLMDAFYKGQLDQTELYRFFLLHQRSVGSAKPSRPRHARRLQTKG